MKNDSKNSEAAFHLFPKLPIELRCLIWRLSMFAPRRIHIMNVCDNNKTSLPSSAAANRESRAEFLSMYTKLFLEPPKNKPRVSFVSVTLLDGPDSGRRDYCATSSYADLSQDALFVGYDDVRRAKKKKCQAWSKALTPQAIQNLKNMIFSMGSLFSTDSVYQSSAEWMETAIEDLEKQVSVFSNLEKVYLRIPAGGKYPDRNHLPNIERLKGRPTVKVEILDDSYALRWS